MKSMNRKALLVRLLALLICCSLFMAACAEGKPQEAEQTPSTNSSQTPPTVLEGTPVDYTITVKTAGGMLMEKAALSIYANGSLQNVAQTNAQGVATVSLPEGNTYTVEVSGVPAGYKLENPYTLTGTNTTLTLSSAPIAGGNLGDHAMKLGDVMYDFTVTTPDGTSITLSKLLETKKMVLLNFWYTGCTWCVTEFPYMDEAYRMFKDDVAVVALDPMGESDAAISAFKTNYVPDLTIPLAACPTTWANAFGITGYPTSVIVDRYGVITLIESGAITSLRPFTSLFETMTADDYEQKLYNNLGEIVTVVEPTYEMPSSEEIAQVLGTSELEITFRPETEGEDAKYSWPFIVTEKNGEACLKASNQGYEDSFAILYADVTLKAGQALGFDFLRSTEAIGDVLYVIVEDEPINSIAGVNDPEIWETTYPLVAEKDGTYEVALCYQKDGSETAGDDTVYIKNMRIVDVSDIDTDTYLPRPAATTEDEFTYEYVDIVYNSKDGYYHVGSAGGPLLLADLLNFTLFNEEQSVWDMAYEGRIVKDGVDYVKVLEEYSNYALNSNLYGICPVNQELYEILQIVDAVAGFDDADDQEWLKICKYFKTFGDTAGQLEDPVAGLAPFSAFEAKLGKNVSTNYFYYNRTIMPRGLFAEFIPSRSGVYRITSRNDSAQGVDGWIFDGDKNMLLAYEHNERMFTQEGEVSMVFYMEAGTPYYINIAFWDLTQTGYIYYDIEYLGRTYDHFIACSPGYFTYDTDATGEAMYSTISGGIDVVLGSDGIYYHDLGNGEKGSKIYADFTGLTGLNFPAPIVGSGDVVGLIDEGAFDFSKTEDDGMILKCIAQYGSDTAKIEEALRNEWGDAYEANYWLYEDVLAGKYHGTGEDYTEIMRDYAKQIIGGSSERSGCVLVDEQLAEILQKLVDKYSFAGIENSWAKLCYYYDYLGQ